MKKIISLFLILCMIVTTTNFTYATASVDRQTINQNHELIFYDNENNPYNVYYDGTERIVVTPVYSTRIGGGIGRCPANKTKIFSYSITRRQAQNALRVINIGEGAIKSLGTLITGIAGWPGIAASVLLNFFGGSSIYTAQLQTFVNSGASRATIKLRASCVNRGYMHGEPMYDYVVNKAYISY